MRPLDVPNNVARDVLARWPARGPAWLAAAAAEVTALCERYSAQSVRVLPARFALVVVASTADRSIVVRSTADPHGPKQAIAAEVMAEIGIGPAVHDVVTSSTSTSVVMDEVRPGTPADDCTVGEVVDLLQPLVSAPAAAKELPPVSTWLRGRLTGDARPDARPDVHPGASEPTGDERAAGLALLDELRKDESHAVCHGDVSLGNVLRGQARLFLIDPRGMAGDVEYDAAVASIKAGLDLRELARGLQVDAARTEAWATVARAARV